MESPFNEKVQNKSRFTFGNSISPGIKDQSFHQNSTSGSSSFVPVPKKIVPLVNVDQYNPYKGNIISKGNTIQSAVDSYNTVFNDNLKTWIVTELTLFKKAYDGDLLGIPMFSLQQVLESLKYQPLAALNNINVELEQAVSSHTAFLHQLKDGIQKISTAFINELKEISWINDNEVDITTVLEQTCRISDPFREAKYTWLKLATECLTKQYSQLRKVITQREMSTARKVVNHLIEAFRSTLNTFADHAPYNHTTLTKIYETLVGKFINIFHISLSYTKRNNAFASKYENMLRKKLHEEYGICNTANQAKCKKAQGQVSKIIDKLRMEYSSAIDGHLDRPDGIEEDKLMEYHQQLSSQLFETLENQVITGVGPNEPVEAHWISLSHHIGEYFSFVRKQNTEKLRIAPSPMLLGETFREIPSLGESQRGVTTKDCSRPLLFRLTMQNLLSCTVVADKLHFFSHSGNKNVPTVVALKDGNFTYQLDRMARNNEDNFEQVWYLEKCFIAGNDEPPWNETVHIQGKPFVVNFEFLLGFLLKEMKNVAEKELSAKFFETVITVPSWLGSTHKIQIKDAAAVGGFSQVHLVNELSAVAFGHVQQVLNEKTSKPDTFVVVQENNNFIHAAVYTYNQQHNIILMLGECMNYCYDGGKDVRKICQSAVNSAYINSFELSISLEKSIKTFLLLSDSDKGKELLKSVTNSMYDLDIPKAVMTGVALLAMKPQEIGLRVRDQIASEILMQYSSSSQSPKMVTKVVIKKEIGLPAESETRLLNPLQQTRDVCFYQIVGPSRTDVPIGKLTVTTTSATEIQPIFTISQEGIVKLAFVKVFFESKSKNYKVYNASAKCVKWVTQNVSGSLREELTAMLSDLDRVGRSQKFQSLEEMDM